MATTARAGGRSQGRKTHSPRRRRRRTPPRSTTRARSRSGAATTGKGEFVEYKQDVVEGMVVLDAVQEIQATQANDLAVPLELQGRQMRLVLGRDQRHAEADVHDAARRARRDEAGDGRADARLSARARSRDRRVVELTSVKKKIQKFTPRPPDAPDGTWRMQQRDIDRVQEFRKCIECFLCQDVCHVLRDHQKHEEFIGPRFLVHAAALEMHPLDTADRVPELRKEHGIGYCNITKCCTKVCPEHITITDNAIIPLKERVVDEFFDPIGKLVKIYSRRTERAAGR